MSPISDYSRVDVIVRYQWTCIVTMMSMKTNDELTFIDIAPMLKINELKNISL